MSSFSRLFNTFACNLFRVVPQKRLRKRTIQIVAATVLLAAAFSRSFTSDALVAQDVYLKETQKSFYTYNSSKPY